MCFIMLPRRRIIVVLPGLWLLFITFHYNKPFACESGGQIAVISCGRLGNQLVQYAVLIAATEKTGYEPVFIKVKPYSKLLFIFLDLQFIGQGPTSLSDFPTFIPIPNRILDRIRFQEIYKH